MYSLKKSETKMQESLAGEFYAAAGCADDPKKMSKEPLREDCIEEMFGVIEEYNKKLMNIVF